MPNDTVIGRGILFSGYAGPVLNPPEGLDFIASVAKNLAMLMEYRKDAPLRDHYSIATISCGGN
jgi:hypothetical protein